MKSMVGALLIGAMLTVAQHDQERSAFDDASSSVSADGRYIAFATFARLADADVDDASDVYVLDRDRQQVTLESTVVPETDGATRGCVHPRLSGDGRYLVYETADQIVLRDRHGNTEQIVGPGHRPLISADGRIILLTSGHDVFLQNVESPTVTRVGADVPGLDAALTSSTSASVSADGRLVAFASRPRHATARTHESAVFTTDIEHNVTRRIGAGWTPAISADGRYVAYVRDERRRTHIFVTDLHDGTTRMITKSVRGGAANGSSASPALSSDGRFVVFQSEASDLVQEEDFNLLWDIFLYDQSTGTTTRVSGDRDQAWMEPSVAPSIGAGGSIVTFSSRHPTGAADKGNDYDLYVVEVRR